MFRPGITSRRLKKWKDEMYAGKHLPSWIRETEDDAERRTKIDGLTIDDLFRSQFRAEADAPRSPIEIIDWGLQHIDRLRKASVEAGEQKTKRLAGIWIPVLSMLIALTALLSTAYLQNKSISSQGDLKKYEISFKPKEDGYGLFMRSVIESYENAYKNNTDALLVSLDRTESAYYSLEPFLTEEERGNVWNQFQQFSFLCYQLREEPLNSPKRDKYHDSYLWYKNWFRTHLYQSLFGQPATAR